MATSASRKNGGVVQNVEKAVMTTAVNNLFSKIIERSPAESIGLDQS